MAFKLEREKPTVSGPHVTLGSAVTTRIVDVEVTRISSLDSMIALQNLPV